MNRHTLWLPASGYVERFTDNFRSSETAEIESNTTDSGIAVKRAIDIPDRDHHDHADTPISSNASTPSRYVRRQPRLILWAVVD